MKKTALFLVSLLMMLGSAEAQNGTSGGRFEWVRGYAPGEHVSIVGSVTDSVGNLYILGSFNFESRWENGELIMPITPHNGAQNGVNTLIAKISPEGEMVWKKVIHGNYCPSQPHDIKAVGDTAFACLVTMPLASLDYYLYYLDTLIEATRTTDQTWPGYPMSAEGVDYRCLALITFDFDGNVLEQHFLQMSFLDCDGEDIYYINPPNDFLSTQTPELPSFAIDGEGNIYLSRIVNDYTSGGPYNGEYNLSEGTISAIKFWCDRRLVGTVTIDSNQNANLHIIKFAPHLDSFLASRLVYQKDSIKALTYTHLKTDELNRVYLLGDIKGVGRGGTNYIDSAATMGIYMNRIYHANKSFIVQYDSSLIPEHLVCFKDSIVNQLNNKLIDFFHDINFDHDSNLVFVVGSASRNVFGDTSSANSFFIISDSVTSLKNNSFVLVLNENDLSLRNYGQLSTTVLSNSQTKPEASKLFVSNNNRIILQYIFYGAIKFPNAIFQTPSIQVPGIGLAIFDYRGNLISGFDYASYSLDNIPGPMQMRDSILYLSMQLTADATFGNIQVPNRGRYTCLIVQYVDTAFMTPYVAPTPGPGPEGISDADTLAINSYPNPVRDMLHIAIDDMVIHATAISLTGVRRQVPAKGNTLDLEALQPGVYILEIATMNRKYHHKIIKL